jgi:hypothetical protein
MEPYAKQKERRVRENRPKISHLPHEVDQRSRKERQREKQAVLDQRRAIKKAARQALQKELRKELETE